MPKTQGSSFMTYYVLVNICVKYSEIYEKAAKIKKSNLHSQKNFVVMNE